MSKSVGFESSEWRIVNNCLVVNAVCNEIEGGFISNKTYEPCSDFLNCKYLRIIRPIKNTKEANKITGTHETVVPIKISWARVGGIASDQFIFSI